MGWFSSSSSSDSSPTPAPTRQARKICWQHRDSYYDCLTKNSILIPPGTDMNDGKSAITKEEKEKEKLKSEKKLKERDTDPCVRERDGYEKNCASSWVSTFGIVDANSLFMAKEVIKRLMLYERLGAREYGRK